MRTPAYKTFDKLSEAKTWAAAQEASDASTAPAQDPSLAKALKRYLTEVTPTKRGSEIETIRVKAWLKHPLAKRPLSSIRSMDIAEWRNARAHQAPSTIKNALTIISQVYVTASSDWGIEGLTNPVRGVRMPRNRPARDRRLEPGEQERFVAACSCSWLEAAFVLSLETALRRGELLSLKRSDIKGRTAYFRLTKNGKPRAVPLSSRALAAINDIPRSIDGRLIPVSAPVLDWRWRSTLKRAGIEGLRWHDLRHEATSRLFEKGLSIPEVASITGHTTWAMLERYTHLAADNLLAKLG